MSRGPSPKRSAKRRAARAAVSARERGLLAELDQVYRDVDAAYRGYRCEDATECCRFAITGREPYITSIELLAVRRAVAARGGPLSPKRRALPLAAAERTCPLLAAGGRCAVYAARPLGCRSYWCRRACFDEKVPRQQLAELVDRVKTIAARHQPDGDRGRPLSAALQDD